jgi:acyl carrier protein
VTAMMSNEAKIIKLFLSNKIKNYDLNIDDDIFELGLVDSLFAMQLVTFIEQEFQVSISNDDLELENFKSISAMQKFVTKKKEEDLLCSSN